MWIIMGGHKKRNTESLERKRAQNLPFKWSSCAARPRSLIGKLVCHVKTSPAHDSKPRDARYLDRETTRWNSRAPARQGPSPEERLPHPVWQYTLKIFNWFESTPKVQRRAATTDPSQQSYN